MSLKIYHLRVRKVESIGSDHTSKIGDRVIKLTGEDSFNKFIAYLPVSGYVKDTPPKIEKVLERNPGGECTALGAKEIVLAQKRVDKILEELAPGYKKEIPDKKYDALEKKYEALLDRIDAKDGTKDSDKKSEDRKSLEAKAAESGIKFDGRTTDDKLIEKIKEIDPEFKK
jgi:hypothetical protein